MRRRLVLLFVALGLAIAPVTDVLCERSCIRPTSPSRVEAKAPCHRGTPSTTGSSMSDGAHGCDHDHAVLIQGSAPTTKSGRIAFASTGAVYNGSTLAAIHAVAATSPPGTFLQRSSVRSSVLRI